MSPVATVTSFANADAPALSNTLRYRSEDRVLVRLQMQSARRHTARRPHTLALTIDSRIRKVDPARNKSPFWRAHAVGHLTGFLIKRRTSNPANHFKYSLVLPYARPPPKQVDCLTVVCYKHLLIARALRPGDPGQLDTKAVLQKAKKLYKGKAVCYPSTDVEHLAGGHTDPLDCLEIALHRIPNMKYIPYLLPGAGYRDRLLKTSVFRGNGLTDEPPDPPLVIGRKLPFPIGA